MLTGQQLQAIKDRSSTITNWKSHDEWFVHNDLTETEAEFIAHAREDVPALIAEVEQLREALAFYADFDSYKVIKHAPYGVTPVSLDDGITARKALGGEHHE